MILFNKTQAQFLNTGIGVYTAEIAQRLKDHDDIVFIQAPYIGKDSLKNKIIRNLWEQIMVPFFMLKSRAQFCHITNNVGVPFLKCGKYVLTVHDVIPLVFPHLYFHNSWKRYSFYCRLKWAVKNSSRIITVSEYSKQDIMKYFHLKPEKIDVVYLGIHPRYHVFSDQKKAMLYEALGEQHFVLGIGGDEPRKNIQRLIKAFLLLKERMSYPGELFIVGQVGEAFQSKYLAYDFIRFLGNVTEERLISLYNLAEIFVFPSLYEGFGLPPLEAMACGTPVVTSNLSSLPEITMDAALHVDPYNIQEIFDAMKRILYNRQMRQVLISKGLFRAKQFTWENTIDGILESYEKV